MDTQDKKNLSEAKPKNAAVTEKTERVENTAPVAAATAKHQQNAAKKPAAKSKAAAAPTAAISARRCLIARLSSIT